ncbi:carbonic anhydrase XVb isoform X2 [Hypomesus transpacificus]|uniref:carbonic anhydrase XVb isoform X2 n=1 Tax=Hypomesus transpacificus TaxID=137520 RepID=UPI001F07793F|nr:carbonic anhydrase XVb isoform X2 [Hypomesus transpacificus]
MPNTLMDSCQIIVVLIASTLLPTVYGAASSVAWCYHDSNCSYTTWPTIATKYCNGSSQSPIDIVSASAKGDSKLTSFTFTKFGDNSSMTHIKNKGKTVQVELASGVQVSGGGLTETYDSLQFHLHWGNGSSSLGSEHTVDGKRFPMELHIVNVKSSLNKNTTLAVQDPAGLAALGFFIEAASGNGTGTPASWKTLTSYLTTITKNGDISNITSGISLDDLLTGVDRTKYYRYQGSLTTPNCNEAVVWTVFKDTIKISQDLINQFYTTVHIDNTSTTLMVNTFRGIQPTNGRVVTTQAASGAGSTSGSSYLLGLMSLLAFLLRR